MVVERRLVECDKFVFDRTAVASGDRADLAPTGGFHIVSLVEGAGAIRGDGFDEPMKAGQTLLLPAACPAATFQASEAATLLDMRLP